MRERGRGEGGTEREKTRPPPSPITQVLTHGADQSTGWRCLPGQQPESQREGSGRQALPLLLPPTHPLPVAEPVFLLYLGQKFVANR